MSTTRIIQRSPDLGIGIRLQRLPQAVQQAATRPQPPWWWGWMDENGQRAATLDVEWDRTVGPYLPDAYWPGHWVAVVDGAIAVRWDIEFTPQLCFGLGNVVWQGIPINLKLPSVFPGTPSTLFSPAKVTLPETLNLGGTDVNRWTYWTGSDQSPGFPEIPIPNLLAAGNTLSVMQGTQSMSGILEATAFVNDIAVGSVRISLVRQIVPGGS